MALPPIQEILFQCVGEVNSHSTCNSRQKQSSPGTWYQGSRRTIYTDIFQFSAAEAWNNLPASKGGSLSLGAFKSGYLKWYSSQ